MQNSDNITGTQPVEIEYPNDGIDIDRMIVPPAIQQRPVQQPINNAPVTRRPIRDEPYIAGSIWLGECVVCRHHDNAGFFLAYENGTPACGHPLCQQCANTILTTTSICPKCRCKVSSFHLARHP
ncbi:unnamed protein product [Adineta steineri]|uniref:RING-type domain-containing protein n=1 Tax=Adineta steineri TaxID=433720 RepID=A0A819MMG6_9BILA|nr:unnamed protein product [Adineta steineri]